jgi:hypothetical protein
MQHVFIVERIAFSEHTLVHEIRGVFEHMYLATRYAKQLQDSERGLVEVTKHRISHHLLDTPTVQEPIPGTGWLPGGEGGQTDPSVSGIRSLGRALIADEDLDTDTGGTISREEIDFRLGQA